MNFIELMYCHIQVPESSHKVEKAGNCCWTTLKIVVGAKKTLPTASLSTLLWLEEYNLKFNFWVRSAFFADTPPYVQVSFMRSWKGQIFLRVVSLLSWKGDDDNICHQVTARLKLAHRAGLLPPHYLPPHLPFPPPVVPSILHNAHHIPMHTHHFIWGPPNLCGHCRQHYHLTICLNVFFLFDKFNQTVSETNPKEIRYSDEQCLCRPL